MTITEIPSISAEQPATLAGAPQWFADVQSAAWQTFLDTPTPSRRDETWRFGDLKQLDFDGYAPAAFADSNDIDIQISGLDNTSAQFIFANDDLVHAEADLPNGVICLPLADALQQHPELVQKHFQQGSTKLGSAKFAALHTAHLSNGLFVYVPKNIEVELPIEVYHIVSGDQTASFPHTLVVTEDNAKVSVIDYFKSSGEEAGLVIAMNELHAGTGSQLSYSAIQDLNLASKIIQINHTTSERDANAKAFTLNVGAAWARNESLSKLSGSGANSDMLSINIPAGEQRYDQRTFQDHEAPHTNSDLLYKNTLFGKAKTVFSGLIAVADGAHYTDAYQTCRNLLMDDTTEANSMPGLQINADQVKCSHGSTAAAISDEEIFYLQARGIRPRQARQLIARGFSVEVAERLGNEALENLVIEYVDTKFETLS
ncbi:Fe-S cluster assembly protein SufD [Rubritalea marina]|uniref:Fe-S cluster assembly protein SufD n=1 Tax=Rubritalea marina TaxID=361055 RepID=UPI000370EB82|nr:Fe-S cluster assembly protein SufD [Rubritalea marina]